MPVSNNVVLTVSLYFEGKASCSYYYVIPVSVFSKVVEHFFSFGFFNVVVVCYQLFHTIRNSVCVGQVSGISK